MHAQEAKYYQVIVWEEQEVSILFKKKAPIGVSEHRVEGGNPPWHALAFPVRSQKGQAELHSCPAELVSAQVRKVGHAWVFLCLIENARYVERQARRSNLLTDTHAQMGTGNQRASYKIDTIPLRFATGLLGKSTHPENREGLVRRWQRPSK